MADYNKSIEISYRADLKQLLGELKKMPGMTEQEAKKMVTQLDRQLKQAEKAAKRTGQNTARGMRQVQTATNQATVSMRNFRTSARSADRVFGELSTGLELISPELGAMAGFASQASSGIEALGRAAGSINPIFLAITVAAGAAALAYQMFSVDTKAVAEEAEKTTQKLKELRDATVGIESGANQARLELAVLKGEISELDAEIAKSEFEIRQEQEAGLEAARQRTEVFKDALRLVYQRQDATKELTEEEQIQLHALQNSFDVLQGIGDLDGKTLAGKMQRLKAEKLLLQAITENKQEENRLSSIVEEQVEITEQLAREKVRQKQEAQEIRAAEKAAAKEAKASAKAAAAARAAAAKEEATRLKLLQEVDKIQAGITKSFMSDAQAIASKYDVQIERLQTIHSELGGQLEIEQDIASLKFLKAQELYDFEFEQQQKLEETKEKARKKEEAARRARIQQELEFVGTLVGAYGSITSAIGTLYENMGKESRKQQLALFRLNKSSEIANIAMITARGITEASARFAGRPIRKALAVSAVVAAGATQAAAVASTPPPTFDMGGMVGNFDAPRPGDTLIRATAGEAILDTATVQRIGGKEGVQALQNGSMATPQVIVMNPFKHLDRYNKSALRRSSALNTESYKSRRFGAMGY